MKLPVDQIVYIRNPISYKDFFMNYLMKNQLCIFDTWITLDWIVCKSWRKSDGSIDLDKVFEPITDKKLSVADCSIIEFDTHPMCDIDIDEFFNYWIQKRNSNDKRNLYLKDWHYFRNKNTNKYFNLPEYFSSDWLNEFWSICPDLRDDFRFVYLGTKCTWTPLHADVYRSFSWSANIAGLKQWWLFPPGEEEKLRLENDHLPYDVRSLQLDSMGVNYFIIDQHPGQVVFVPSGWYHQVVNLVSNWLSTYPNGFN